MKITQQQMQRFARSAIRDTRQNVQQSQRVAASGKRIEDPSDDPAGSARARILHSLSEESESHVNNANFGKLRLGQADQSLSEATNLLIRVKELTLAMANDTVSQPQRKLAAQEMKTLKRSLIDIANTKQNGEYIFAHVNTSQQPVDNTGAFTYDVNQHNAVRRVETGPSSTAEIGASGSNAFAQRASDPNSVNVFDLLTQVTNDMNSGDSDAIRAHVDQINFAIGQVVSERTEVGVRMNRIENARTHAKQGVELYKRLESEIMDADAAEAFSKLQLAHTGLQAAISVSARVLGPSLLDKL